jgi:hypothetical protein
MSVPRAAANVAATAVTEMAVTKMAVTAARDRTTAAVLATAPVAADTGAVHPRFRAAPAAVEAEAEAAITTDDADAGGGSHRRRDQAVRASAPPRPFDSGAIAELIH